MAKSAKKKPLTSVPKPKSTKKAPAPKPVSGNGPLIPLSARKRAVEAVGPMLAGRLAEDSTGAQRHRSLPKKRAK